jgi:FkbM family methyltransferase
MPAPITATSCPACRRPAGRGHGSRAFEPGEENYRCARITLLLNGLDNVTLTHAGLGATEAAGHLVTRDASGKALGGGSRLRPAGEGGAREGGETVALVPLDGVVPAERRIAAIHLDVEGHEAEALLGAMRTVARWKPVLLLETVPGAEWLSRHLAPLGYRRAGMVDDNTVFEAAPS